MSENRLTVLVVDDTPANIDILMHMLSASYKIRVATTGAVALKLAEKEPRPNLVLLDVFMPGMDGHEVCRQLKANPATAQIPVIFVTATAEEKDVEKGRSLGAAGFLSKPLEANAVLEVVRRTIKS
jgi:CheY-like chemotaxis protein